jgi:hypothetical protein
MCSLNALGGKPLVNGSTITFNTFNMIPDFLLYN